MASSASPITSYQQQPFSTGYQQQQQQQQQQRHTSTTTYQQGPVYTAESHATNTYVSGGQPSATSTSFGQFTPATGTYNQYSTHAEIPTGSRMVTGQTVVGQERVQQRRKVSSTVVSEQLLGPMPQDYPSREVEVPFPGGAQEKITYVPVKQVVETEKIIPRVEVQWVEKIVEVPRVEYTERIVEVPRYQEVIREVRVPQVIDRPYEVKKEVRIPVVVPVEKTREVPGETIMVPQPFPVKQAVEVVQYVDRKHPIVVSQTVQPYIVEGAGTVEVDVYEYEPECVPVDVHVIKAVQARVQAGGVVGSTHKVVSIPAAQYNKVLQQLNVHLSQQEQQKLPYLTENGQVTLLGERITYSEPQVALSSIEGFDHVNLMSQHVDYSSRRVMPVPGYTDEYGVLLPQYSQMTTTTTTTTTNTGATMLPATVSNYQMGSVRKVETYAS